MFLFYLYLYSPKQSPTNQTSLIGLPLWPIIFANFKSKHVSNLLKQKLQPGCPGDTVCSSTGGLSWAVSCLQCFTYIRSVFHLSLCQALVPLCMPFLLCATPFPTMGPAALSEGLELDFWTSTLCTLYTCQSQHSSSCDCWFTDLNFSSDPDQWAYRLHFGGNSAFIGLSWWLVYSGLLVNSTARECEWWN